VNERVSPPPADETGGRDVIEVAVSGALNLVPGVGGWLSNGVQKVFAQQEQQRLNDWLAEFAAVVNRLIEQVEGLTIEALAGSADFYDLAVRAARSASASSAEGKHRALQNALYNSGVGASIEADMQAVFLRYVDELTVSHLRLLRFFANPGAMVSVEDQRRLNSSMVSSVQAGVEAAFPEWHGQAGALMQTFASDLTTRALLPQIPFNSMTTGSGGLQPRITPLGVQFLDYLSGPFDAVGSATSTPDGGGSP